MRGKSANPNLTKLDRVAQALKVERNWLIHGMGGVQGEAPIVEHPDHSFVASSSVAVRPSMGGGIWSSTSPWTNARIIFNDLGSSTIYEPIRPICASCTSRGDSMMPTLYDGDIVPLYKPYEGSGEEVNIIGRIRWFAREM